MAQENNIYFNQINKLPKYYALYRYKKVNPTSNKRMLSFIKLIIRSRAAEGHRCATFSYEFKNVLKTFCEENSGFCCTPLDKFRYRVTW